MGISGLVQSYDSRAASSAALSRTIMAPQFQYAPVHTYSGVSTRNLVATHQVQQQNHFSYNGYSGPNNVIIPAFASNFVQQRPFPRLMQVDDDVSRTVSYARTSRPGYAQEHHSQIPPIKTEPQWSVPPPIMRLSSNTSNMASTSTQPQEVSFGTEVDFLMKAIQAKTQTQPQTTSSAEQNRPVDDSTSPKGGKKRYYCTIANCNKSFYQKTQLNIHERAHTGVKPYACKEPGCSRTFSQLGNLKTHERRHTGERPYSCEICGKRFSQRSNVRAHKIVHDQSKPYKCRLDHCDKNFTQLGNLKSHQNKFHVPTIRRLTAKYTSAQGGDVFNAAEKELWEYFANLYKNSNKGIKGRGKDRKVGANSHSSPSNSGINLNSDMRGLGLSGGRGFGVPGGGRGNMVVGVGAGVGMGGVGGMGRGDVNQGAYEQKYEMFDMDEESQVWA